MDIIIQVDTVGVIQALNQIHLSLIFLVISVAGLALVLAIK